MKKDKDKDIDFCIHCRKDTHYTWKKERLIKRIKDKEYIFNVDCAVCDECGEDMCLPGSIDKMTSEIMSQYRAIIDNEKASAPSSKDSDIVFFVLECSPSSAETCAAVYHACDSANWLRTAGPRVAVRFASWEQYDALVTAYGLERVVAVGGVDFAQEALARYNAPPIKALNIPPEIDNECYTGRRIWRDVKKDDVNDIAKEYPDLLIKPGLTPKAFDAMSYDPYTITTLPEGEPLFLSERLKQDIVSEWRVFAYDGRVASYHPYALDTDELKTPDTKLVRDMLRQLRGYGPITLDVAVLEDGRTVAIEAHRFISCGLYGFGGVMMLDMLQSAWYRQVMLGDAAKA